MLVRGAIKVYTIGHLSGAERQVNYPAMTTQQREQYCFMPVSAVLTGDVHDTKQFQRDPKQARDFIEQLNLTDAQLEDVLKPLGLATGADSAALAQAIASDQVVVARAPVSRLKPPAADAEQALDSGPTAEMTAKPVSLGPHETGGVAAAVAAKKSKAEEKPLCSLQSAIIQCSHGRRVQITKETRVTPSLSVISTETKAEGLERISAEIKADELCASHQRGAFKISKEHSLKSTSATGIAPTFLSDSGYPVLNQISITSVSKKPVKQRTSQPKRLKYLSTQI
ncbi:MAG: hypothetical protein COB33_008395 [Thiotrichaceae bacterium]|nr:hypothetical protein [Thiotrichaceae bacterium]